MKKLTLICSLSFFTLICFGQSVKVSSFSEIEKRIYASNDSVYVVNFWATWCAPCIEELPYFDQLQKDFSSDKLKVILVSLDFKTKMNTTLIPFIQKKKVQSEIYLLDEKDMNNFINRVDQSWSGAIPATMIIDHRSGKKKFYESEFTYEELKAQYLTFTKTGNQ